MLIFLSGNNMYVVEQCVSAEGNVERPNDQTVKQREKTKGGRGGGVR